MLSNKLFIVMGRLTYSMYIVHVPILVIINFRVETSTVFSNANTVSRIKNVDNLAILLILVFSALRTSE